ELERVVELDHREMELLGGAAPRGGAAGAQDRGEDRGKDEAGVHRDMVAKARPLARTGRGGSAKSVRRDRTMWAPALRSAPGGGGPFCWTFGPVGSGCEGIRVRKGCHDGRQARKGRRGGEGGGSVRRP